MTLSNDLFMAILAMDSYNRGYGAGIGDPNTGLSGTQIGNATLRNDVLPSGYKSASFFAQSYTYAGKTIISYRGTDTLKGDLAADAIGGSGSFFATQTKMAADFYRSINGNSTAKNANIELTGHSLGGGLAGFVGSIYGLKATLFNNMAFELGSNNVATLAKMQPDSAGVPNLDSIRYSS
jgi:putative lipase involved disintegration of autophagic bodies